MPFEPAIPTIAALQARAVSDIDVALGVEQALLDTQPEFVLATNAAALAYGNYLALRHLALQVIPSASNDDDVLDQHARLWLGASEGRRAASPATLTIVGSGTAGTTVPSGTRWRSSTGALYATAAELEFGTDDIRVTAIAANDTEPGWGASGNLVPGVTLTLADEVVGLDAEWTVDGDPLDGPVGGGADRETSAELAARIEFRAQNPPRGGTLEDFEAWAREVAGVGQAWAYKGLAGPGTVTVFFVRDDATNPIPDSTLVANVQAYLDLKAPAQAGVIQAVAPSPVALNPRLLLKPNTAATRAASTASINETVALRSVASDGSIYFDISWLSEAVSTAVGEEGHTLTAPVADVQLAIGEIAVVGNILYFTKP